MTGRFLAGRGRERLSAAEQQAIDDAVAAVRMLPARHALVRAGERVEVSTLLLDGFMCRYMDDRDGHRQLVAVHVPGDFVDLHSFPMHRLDHDVATITACTVATFDHRTLTDLTERMPHLTRALWFSTLLDAAMHREWIFRLGRLGADGRIAHFFSEVNARLEMVGLAAGGRFELPLTQADLAETTGITGVHVNRVLRRLRERGVLLFKQGEATILDLAVLHGLGEFDPAYLYGSGQGHAEAVR